MKQFFEEESRVSGMHNERKVECKGALKSSSGTARNFVPKQKPWFHYMGGL